MALPAISGFTVFKRAADLQGEISYTNTTDDSVYSSGERNMSEIEKGGLLRPPDRFSVEIYFSLAYTASTKSLSN
ncbi:hypothetical protein V512_008620 [Mesotoga sp. Brook.08.105.5.1]|nr:hypothetical protein V512_008620 [Mesotoga sp. Brook.08.105.5.1]